MPVPDRIRPTRVRRTPVPPTLQSLANRNLKTWQIGPAMKHNASVDGAVLTKDETRILSWSGDHTVRLWDAGWPKGNLLEIACALLPIEDRDASSASKHYSVTISAPICTPTAATVVPGWSQIERAPPD